MLPLRAVKEEPASEARGFLEVATPLLNAPRRTITKARAPLVPMISSPRVQSISTFVWHLRMQRGCVESVGSFEKSDPSRVRHHRLPRPRPHFSGRAFPRGRRIRASAAGAARGSAEAPAGAHPGGQGVGLRRRGHGRLGPVLRALSRRRGNRPHEGALQNHRPGSLEWKAIYSSTFLFLFFILFFRFFLFWEDNRACKIPKSQSFFFHVL